MKKSEKNFEDLENEIKNLTKEVELLKRITELQRQVIDLMGQKSTSNPVYIPYPITPTPVLPDSPWVSPLRPYATKWDNTCSGSSAASITGELKNSVLSGELSIGDNNVAKETIKIG